MMEFAHWLRNAFCVAVLCSLLAGCGGSGDPAVVTGDPLLVFSSVPAYGTYADLKGKALNVNPEEYRVAVFICVGGWWNKPYWTSPLTTIQKDGSWSCDITTGGNDAYATRIAAFLVSSAYVPPNLSGHSAIPGDVYDNSVASLEVVRSGSETERVIRFSGYDWTVKKSQTPVGPPDAGNYFSDSAENVWVDSQGRLHMKIARRDGKWWCSEVICGERLGYGTYSFTIATDPASLNERVVLGLFTWDDDPAYAHRELDIEFSRWGTASDPNAQYVVQPWEQPGHRQRFTLPAISGESTHSFTWRAGTVDFRSLQGATALASWSFTGDAVPLPGNERARISLWLVNGSSSQPSDGREAEVIISSFDFRP